MCGALPPTLTGPAAEWYVFVLAARWHMFFGWLAAWRASHNDEETVSNKDEKATKSMFWGVWGHLGAPCGAQGVAGSPFSRFFYDFCLMLASLFDVIFEDIATMGGSGAQGECEMVSR